MSASLPAARRRRGRLRRPSTAAATASSMRAQPVRDRAAGRRVRDDDAAARAPPRAGRRRMRIPLESWERRPRTDRREIVPRQPDMRVSRRRSISTSPSRSVRPPLPSMVEVAERLSSSQRVASRARDSREPAGQPSGRSPRSRHPRPAARPAGELLVLIDVELNQRRATAGSRRGNVLDRAAADRREAEDRTAAAPGARRCLGTGWRGAGRPPARLRSATRPRGPGAPPRSTWATSTSTRGSSRGDGTPRRSPRA